jgi:hypothetical protein
MIGMAIFTIQMDTSRNENRLVVAPDWVNGASKDDAFVMSTATDGTMSSWYYDEFDIRNMITYLSKKLTDKYESEKFKNILFQLHSVINGSGNIQDIYYKDIEYLTYIINSFRPDNIITRKFNFYLPPSKTYKEKQRLLYVLVALQHVSCEKSGRLDLRIPTVGRI